MDTAFLIAIGAYTLWGLLKQPDEHLDAYAVGWVLLILFGAGMHYT